MSPIDFSQLIRQHKLISDQVDSQELVVILEQLVKSLAMKGSIVEFGCYKGTTSLYIRRVLDQVNDSREFHVYDSFMGLPVKTIQDQSPLGIQFKEGELTASKKQFIQEFKKAHLVLPEIHKGWFSEFTDADIPNQISFAFLDGDYYDSIKSSFALIESRLVQGAIAVVDDYVNEALPGAAKAVNEWCAVRGYSVQAIHSVAVIHCTQF